MRKRLERPVVFGCYLAVLYLMLAACGWSCERLGQPLEPSMAAGVSQSSGHATVPGMWTNTLGRASDVPCLDRDILNDDDCAEEFDFRLVASRSGKLAQPQSRSLGRSDLDHTTLARGLWARFTILRC
jgi:hypothetical protein